MVVFHILKILWMVPNRATEHDIFDYHLFENIFYEDSKEAWIY